MDTMNLSNNDIIKLFILGFEVCLIFFLLPCVYYLFKNYKKPNLLKTLGFAVFCFIVTHIAFFCSFWLAINIGSEIPILILAIIGAFFCFYLKSEKRVASKRAIR